MKQKLSDYGINGDDNSKEYSNPQTAVEWIWLNLTDDLIGDLAPEKILKIHKLIEQANAMFEEQIKNSYHSGTIDGFNFRTTSISPNPEQYYNETFKSE